MATEQNTSKLFAASADLLEVAKMRGIYKDIIACADEWADDCPKWADFFHRLKERATWHDQRAADATAKAEGR